MSAVQSLLLSRRMKHRQYRVPYRRLTYCPYSCRVMAERIRPERRLVLQERQPLRMYVPVTRLSPALKVERTRLLTKLRQVRPAREMMMTKDCPYLNL